MLSSYGLVYGDRTVIVDTAFNFEIAKAMEATSFDHTAYARVSAALPKADLIIVTHEHPDYVGGLLAQPGLQNC